MRKKYYRVFVNRLRSTGPSAVLRQAWNFFAVRRAGRRGACPPAPLSATLALTYRCNQRCVMCNFPSRARADREEMPTGRAREIIDELAGMGASGVSFYGGEPLLRRDIVELASHARRMRLMTHIPTNGMLLTAAAAERLVGAGVDLITISLDGGTAETHDRQRGVPGAFEAARRAVGNVVRARARAGRPCHCALAATITSGNAGETGEIIRAAREFGADTISLFEAQELTGLLNEGNREALVRAHERIRAEKRKTPDFIDNSEAYIGVCLDLLRGVPPRGRCFAPLSDIFIDAYEDVFPCNYFFGMARPIGNLGGGSVRAFWASGAYEEKRAELAGCALCNYMCHRELSLMLGGFRLRGPARAVRARAGGGGASGTPPPA